LEQTRTHHFDNGDVITGLCPNGEFGAYLERHDGRIRGYGHTRFAAIADLVESLDLQEPEDFDRQAAAFDHAHDLRKNWERV
jgi:hypothetical protein